MIRLFAAIAVPDDMAEGLVRRQQGLAGARWRSPEQMHITLRFFGEVAEPVAADIDAGLAGVVADPFDVQLAGVGSFGEGHQVRAVWAGVEPSAPLSRLAAKCESVARRAGLKPEPRAYQPHLTLAYMRSAADPARVAAWIAGHNLLRAEPFRATWFGLYSSWQSPQGSRYDLEREYPLF